MTPCSRRTKVCDSAAAPALRGGAPGGPADQDRLPHDLEPRLTQGVPVSTTSATASATPRPRRSPPRRRASPRARCRLALEVARAAPRTRWRCVTGHRGRPRPGGSGQPERGGREAEFDHLVGGGSGIESMSRPVIPRSRVP